MSIYPTNDNAVIPTFHAGDRLGKARELVELSQTEFGNELGVSRGTVSRWERGMNIKRSTLMLYSLRTGVPVEWLETGKYTPRDSNPEPTD